MVQSGHLSNALSVLGSRHLFSAAILLGPEGEKYDTLHNGGGCVGGGGEERLAESFRRPDLGYVPPPPSSPLMKPCGN